MGNPESGHRLERIAYNCLPGTFTDDMWAHQYNQQPNQVQCSLDHEPWTTDGPESNLYGLEPNFGCCTANFHQGWPKFTNSLFLLSGAQDSDLQDGLAAVAYAPCELQTILRGTPVRIVEETDYPFRGHVLLSVDPAAPIHFPLQLRIPAWAAGTVISINDSRINPPAPSSFARIDRTWNAGDRVEIVFPMTPRISRWFNNSVVVERGPLVFSYGIAESWVKLRDRGMTADWQVFPTRQWNYALVVGSASPAKSIVATESE